MQHKQLGFVLVDVIICVAILSLVIPVLMSSLNQAALVGGAGLKYKQALSAAEGLLDEVVRLPFSGVCYTGPHDQAHRSNFSCIDDYSGFSMTGIYAPTGTAPVAGLDTLTVSVSIDTSAGVILGTINNVSLVRVKKVTVTVTPPNGVPMNISQYVTNHG